MLTLIHGDNTGQSRSYYLDIKNHYTNIKVLNADKLNLTDLIEAVEGDGLFSTIDAVFIELLFSKKKAGAELDAIVAYLNKQESTIVLWEGKELTKAQAGKVKNATIKLFSFPKTLFQLLDALQPHNGKQLITLFHQTLQNEAAELILFMLTKQVRILLALQNRSTETISEAKFIQSWQIGKLQKQAKSFSSEQLQSLHNKLYAFDIGYKTGGLATPLESSLDFFFAEI